MLSLMKRSSREAVVVAGGILSHTISAKSGNIDWKAVPAVHE